MSTRHPRPKSRNDLPKLFSVMIIALTLCAVPMMSQETNKLSSSGPVGIWNTSPTDALWIGNATLDNRLRIEGIQPFMLGMKNGTSGVYAWMGVTTVGAYQ